MNTQLHKNFPLGKGIWIWEIWACVGKASFDQVTPEDLQTIIQKCKDNDISYVLVKCGDGENTWEQWTPELIKSFHDAGIKIYSWSYVYGDNPLREAGIAMWALDMGADGHVFDAEEEYQGKGESARTMMQAVRNHTPNSFLAYAPFPIIDYHENYPYIEFGKYADAVMPQMYAGDLEKTPFATITWTMQQFQKWQEIWTQGGFADSVKPIIPLGQAYDGNSWKQNGQDIANFIRAGGGYFSVCFWSFQHIYKQEVWDAIKNNNVDLPVTQQQQIQAVQTDQLNKPNDAGVTVNTPEPVVPAQPQVQPQADTQSVSQKGGTGGTTQPQPPIVGINSGNSIQSRQSKKHIDYVCDFVILILKGLRLMT